MADLRRLNSLFIRNRKSNCYSDIKIPLLFHSNINLSIPPAFRAHAAILRPGYDRAPPFMAAGMAFPPYLFCRAPMDSIRAFPVPHIVEVSEQFRGFCLQIRFTLHSQLAGTVWALCDPRASLPAVRGGLPFMPFGADPPNPLRAVGRNLRWPDPCISCRMPLPKKFRRG